MSNSQYTAIDLFCGAGGLSVGLNWAGFDVRWAIDSDEQAVDTYAANNGDTPVENCDINNIEFLSLDLNTDIDLIAGGPPCPTFSIIGRAKLKSLNGRGIDGDGRHQLWREFLRAIRSLEPEVFLMENVQGMESAENAAGQPVLPIILDSMRNLGYRVDATVVDAADFGVPQRRKRLFIIGNRLDKSNPDLAEWKTHREPRSEKEKRARLLSAEQVHAEQQTLAQYRDDNSPDFQSEVSRYRHPWVTVAEAILDLPPLSPAGNGSADKASTYPPSDIKEYHVPAVTEYQQWARNTDDEADWENQPLHNHCARFHNLDDISIYKMLGEATGWTIRELGSNIQPYRADVFKDNYTKQNPTEPASTIDAHIHKDGHRHIHPTEARSLTVREAARLQSFRDTYHFPVSRTEAYRQVGNAVPPLLAKKIGGAIRDTLLS